MSNSFPSMISNEPPPLEQSDDDEDSEELQDLGHGLNLDLDPSPMATPIKIPSTVSDGNTVLETAASQSSKVSFSNHSSLPVADKPIESIAAPPDVSKSSLQTTVSDAQSAKPRSPSIPDVFTSAVIEEDNRENPVTIATQETEVIEDRVVANQQIEVVASSEENIRQEVVTNINFESCDDDDSCDEFVSYSEPKSSTKEEQILPEPSEEVKEDINIDGRVTGLTSETSLSSALDPAENIVENGQSGSSEVAADVATTSDFAEEIKSDVNEAEETIEDQKPDEPPNDNGAIEDDDEFGEFTDFADFNAFPAPTIAPTPQAPSISTNEAVAEVPQEPTADDDDDEFDAFQTADNPQTASMEQMSQPPQPTPASALHLPKFTSNLAESLVQGLFAKDFSLTDIPDEILRPIDNEIKQDGNESRWKKVEDFEGSQGLMFKWPNSVAYQNLLRSLNIDNSTIMYKGKWGIIEVPRFAASLVDSPLLPESGSKGSEAAQTQFDGFSGGKPETRISDNTMCQNLLDLNIFEAFYTGESLSEDERPQEIVSKVQAAPRNGLSAEAERILSQLPDLSYMRAKTLVFPTDLPT